MADPTTFITIGGVRYHKDSVTNYSENSDSNGNKIYNVTLEGGTKISYPKQGKSGEGYTVDFFRRGNNNPNMMTYSVKYLGSQQPLILADKPMNNNNMDVSISIFGLKNATIQGNPNINEDLELTNCENNIIHLDDGNNIDGNDTIGMFDMDAAGISHPKPNKNNTIYLDKSDSDNGWKLLFGNKIIQDNE